MSTHKRAQFSCKWIWTEHQQRDTRLLNRFEFPMSSIQWHENWVYLLVPSLRVDISRFKKRYMCLVLITTALQAGFFCPTFLSALLYELVLCVGVCQEYRCFTWCSQQRIMIFIVLTWIRQYQSTASERIWLWIIFAFNINWRAFCHMSPIKSLLIQKRACVSLLHQRTITRGPRHLVTPTRQLTHQEHHNDSQTNNGPNQNITK